MHHIFKTQLNSNQDEPEFDGEGGIAVEPAKPELKRPSMYSVIMLNDDYTPMEFVVEVLQKLFGKNAEEATQIMLAVHTKGSAVCAIYSRDVAETKAAMVNQYSRDCNHPLMCEIAPVED
ncbi:ATP-dependent Clp protease adapter ClpS [Bacterioplanoides sp. SCSIO 12839]|uniref:ATP-dependent Clp protease adapter ClpS n=1 Tax=Bacterioplanoides sp. SCSIO 12839 TaxID=2829569 RepID=UPI002101F343|nr:ATP-dependent Clp protease adapter ClpS [Bacterioplanoides sp. SCSIO 12839]UTW46784.1 ATP-dependent Clp protease adapter ClpS [Bacterioplanoides sp. SCSIO 12839]